MSKEVTSSEIEVMSTSELKQMVADLTSEINDIKIQLDERSITMSSYDYKVWSRSALLAKKYKNKARSACQLRLSVINAENKRANISASTPPQEKELKAIINEIKMLVSPVEFLECCERGKLKAEFDREIKKINKEK